MHKVLIVGAGKIGSLIACLLQKSGNYEVLIADLDFSGSDIKKLQQALPQLKLFPLDMAEPQALRQLVASNPVDAIISCLPFFLNVQVAEVAKEFGLNYFDLTEDVSVTSTIKQLADKAENAFVPQCGLAPGFVGIVANDLIKHFEELNTVKLRVGALPAQVSNGLHYALTWSTDGLINQYANPCYAIEKGKPVWHAPLDSEEILHLDGLYYEAFNTSGGLGSLAELYEGKVQTMNYKTIRYPGHCELMRFLMVDLKLQEDRATLKRILENSIPKTYQDVVVVYVAVSGKIQGEFTEETYMKKYYPQTIEGIVWAAIQLTTASGLCSVLDIVLNNSQKYHGFVYQEQISLKEILDNPFGKPFI